LNNTYAGDESKDSAKRFQHTCCGEVIDVFIIISREDMNYSNPSKVHTIIIAEWVGITALQSLDPSGSINICPECIAKGKESND